MSDESWIFPDGDLNEAELEFALRIRAFAEEKVAPHARRIDEECTFRRESVAELAAAVNDADAGLDTINVDERSAELSSVAMVLSVRDRAHLNRVVQRLKTVSAVQSVERITR